jgi:hypothetical protein
MNVPLKSEYEAYLRREVRRGLEELDRGERALFNAETIIAQKRRRLARQRVSKRPSTQTTPPPGT